MTPKQVLAHFKTPPRFSENTEFSKEALYKWLKQDYIPAKSQLEIAVITGGILKVGKPYEAQK